MQISESQTNEASLISFGAEAVKLLQSGDIDTLADRFGYALAFDQKPATAIREDLASCLVELQATSLESVASAPTVTVRYFNPNNSGLFAVVECLALANNGTPVLVELIVTTKGAEKHICLEQLSTAA